MLRRRGVPFSDHMSAKVLVVDDSMMVRTQVSRVLTQAGFTVTAANDGVDALAKLIPEMELIVCDVNMPNMSGIELLEELRVARQNKIPFVMLTTEDQGEMVARAKALGANGWLVKPLKPELLLNTAKKLTTTT
jgi:two-component system chemotaxis response regulator CheY